MNATLRGAFRTLLPLALGAALLDAATVRAQSAPPPKADSAARATTADSAAAPKPKKRGFLSRAIGAATQAAAAVQQKTGIDAQTALQGAALVAARANPAMAMMQAMQSAQQAQAGKMAAAGLGGVTGMAQMQAMQRMQQMMLSGAATGVPEAADPALAALQLQVAQMATLAAQGDRNAMGQLMRFQGEMAGAMMRMGALAPAQQRSALPAAMRAAIACAMTPQQCTTAAK